MKTNVQLRQESIASLNGRWGASIVPYLIYTVIVGGVIFMPIVGNVSSLISLPLSYGLILWYLKLRRSSCDEPTPDVSIIFDGFTDYVRVTFTMMLQGVYIFLWTLLFIIPGVVKSLSYSLTPYILIDEPELSYNSAIERSMAMMEGRKMQMFLMLLNFTMWFVLSLFTLGIGFLWLYTYIFTTMASFYEEAKAEYNAMPTI